MRTRSIWVAALVAFGVALVGWSDSIVEGELPFTVEVSSETSSATVGDSIEFIVRATGTALFASVLAFGDGVSDTTFAQGARTLQTRRFHAYDSAGTFVARATVFDGASLGLTELSDAVTVTGRDP